MEGESCTCIRELHRKCENLSSKLPVGEWLFKDPEMGRVAYTISILLMFSLVIVMLMVRSIRRTNSAVEMDTLLDAMRFREELDLQERQRRRLLRAKNKVTAWLTRADNAKNGEPGRVWQSSPQLISQPRKKSSFSSTVSEIPAIVVTDDALIRRAHTPCLSLIYDFNERKESMESMVSRESVSNLQPPSNREGGMQNNCSSLAANLTADCYKAMLQMISQANNEVWTQYKNSRENKIGADMYTIVILGLFGTVILCLLFRSMKKSDSVDDQVMLLLSSMQIHVDYEERIRQRRRMKEEKDKTQSFITDLALRSFRRFARSRSSSHVVVKERPSVCSVPTRPYSPFQNVPHRARSYQGYLPEIVVTDHHQHHQGNFISVPRSQPITPMSSRHNSSGSYDSRLQHGGSETGSVFVFSDDGATDSS